MKNARKLVISALAAITESSSELPLRDALSHRQCIAKHDDMNAKGR